MFGYVTVNKPELRIREYERYHAFYCGLCEVLRRKYGRTGQLTLTYDMTFLVLLLTSLYEPDTRHAQCRCIVHPAKKHDILINDITEYAADMNVVLAYHKFADDRADDNSSKAAVGMRIYKKRYNNIFTKYPYQCGKIEKYLSELHKLEQEQCTDVDLISGCFGKIMGVLFCYRKDVFTKYLKKTGFYLGKFIYLMDAWIDLEDDREHNSYNPFLFMERSFQNKEELEQECERLLTAMIAECSQEFEKLPLIQDREILRNILYAGVWQKYDKKKNKCSKEGNSKNGERSI